MGTVSDAAAKADVVVILVPDTIQKDLFENEIKPNLKAGDAITDAIFCASTYTFADTQSVIDFIEQKQEREEYGRYGNPGEKVVERKLAALEGGEDAILFSSRSVDGATERWRRSHLLQ